MLNLLYIPAWTWIVSAIIIVIAAIAVAGILVYDEKIGLGKKKDSSSDGETAAADGNSASAKSSSKAAKTESKKVKTKKTVVAETSSENNTEESAAKPAKKTAAQTAVQTSSEKKTAKPAEKTATAKPAAEKPAEKTAKPVAAKPTATATKSAAKVYHISKRKEDGKWQIKAAGGEKAIKLFKTQKEAIDYCKTLADNQEASIMIHKEDGSFRKLTY